MPRNHERCFFYFGKEIRRKTGEIRELLAINDIKSFLQQRENKAHAEKKRLPYGPPSPDIEFLSGTHPMQENTLSDNHIFTIPEFHTEEMHIMPAMGEPCCKFPDTFFHAAFNEGIDYIVNNGDFHRADLFLIIVLIEKHHTLEHSKEKYLYSAYDQYEGKNCSRDFGKETEISQDPMEEDIETEQYSCKD